MQHDHIRKSWILTRSEVKAKVKLTTKVVHDNPPSQDASTLKIWDSYLNQNRRITLDMIILKIRSDKSHSDLIMIRNTPPYQDAPTHQIRDSYIKLCRRYAPVTIIKKEVKVKVTVTPKWHATLCHPKMHSNNNIGIPTSNNVGYMLRTQLYSKSGQGSRSLCHQNETRNFPRYNPTQNFEILPQIM